MADAPSSSSILRGKNTTLLDIKNADSSLKPPTIEELVIQIESRSYGNIEQQSSLLIAVWSSLGQLGHFRDFHRVFRMLYRESALLILGNSWSRSDVTYKRGLSRALLQFVKGAEGEVGALCSALVNALHDPWGDNLLQQLITRDDLDDSLVREAVGAEPPDLLLLRVESLVTFGHVEAAIRLLKGCLNAPFSENNQEKEEWRWKSMEWLLRLLFRKRRLQDIVAESSSFSCHDGVRLIYRTLETQMEDSGPLTETLINLFLVRDILFNSDNCCTAELMKLWCDLQHQQKRTAAEIEAAARQLLVGHASSSAHFYLLGDMLWKQYGKPLLPLYLELYIRGLTSDLNYLEAARQGNNIEMLHEMEEHIASVYFRLFSLFNPLHRDIALECLLSSFSLHPSREKMDYLRKLHLQMTRGGNNNLKPGAPTIKRKVVTCDRAVQVGDDFFLDVPSKQQEEISSGKQEHQTDLKLEQQLDASKLEVDEIQETVERGIVNNIENLEQKAEIKLDLKNVEFQGQGQKEMNHIEHLVDKKKPNDLLTIENHKLVWEEEPGVKEKTLEHHVSSSQSYESEGQLKQDHNMGQEHLVNDINSKQIVDNNSKQMVNETALKPQTDEKNLKNQDGTNKLGLFNEEAEHMKSTVDQETPKELVANGEQISSNEKLFVIEKSKDISNYVSGFHVEMTTVQNEQQSFNGFADDNSCLKSTLLSSVDNVSFPNSCPPKTIPIQQKVYNCEIVLNKPEIQSDVPQEKNLEHLANDLPVINEKSVNHCKLDQENMNQNLENYYCGIKIQNDKENNSLTDPPHGQNQINDNKDNFVNGLNNSEEMSVLEKQNESNHKICLSNNNVSSAKETVRSDQPENQVAANNCDYECCASLLPFSHIVLDSEIMGISPSLMSDFVTVLESLRNWNLKNCCRWSQMKYVCECYLDNWTRSRNTFANNNESLDSEPDSLSEITGFDFQENSSDCFEDPRISKATILRRFMDSGEKPTYINLSDIHCPTIPLERLFQAERRSISPHGGHKRRHRKHKKSTPILKKFHHDDALKRKKRKRRKTKKTHNKKYRMSSHSKQYLKNRKRKRHKLKKKKENASFISGDYCSDFSSTELMRLVKEHEHGTAHKSSTASDEPQRKKCRKVSFGASVSRKRKHKHDKSNKSSKRKKLVEETCIQEQSDGGMNIVKFSSVKKMESVQIRQRSTVAVKVNNQPSKQAASVNPAEMTKEFRFERYSPEDIMKMQMMMCRQHPSGISTVASTIPQSLVKYVCSKTTSKLLSVAHQSSANYAALGSDSETSKSPLPVPYLDNMPSNAYQLSSSLLQPSTTNMKPILIDPEKLSAGNLLPTSNQMHPVTTNIKKIFIDSSKNNAPYQYARNSATTTLIPVSLNANTCNPDFSNLVTSASGAIYRNQPLKTLAIPVSSNQFGNKIVIPLPPATPLVSCQTPLLVPSTSAGDQTSVIIVKNGNTTQIIRSAQPNMCGRAMPVARTRLNPILTKTVPKIIKQAARKLSQPIVKRSLNKNPPPIKMDANKPPINTTAGLQSKPSPESLLVQRAIEEAKRAIAESSVEKKSSRSSPVIQTETTNKDTINIVSNTSSGKQTITSEQYSTEPKNSEIVKQSETLGSDQLKTPEAKTCESISISEVAFKPATDTSEEIIKTTSKIPSIDDTHCTTINNDIITTSISFAVSASAIIADSTEKQDLTPEEKNTNLLQAPVIVQSKEHLPKQKQIESEDKIVTSTKLDDTPSIISSSKMHDISPVISLNKAEEEIPTLATNLEDKTPTAILSIGDAVKSSTTSDKSNEVSKSSMIPPINEDNIVSNKSDTLTDGIQSTESIKKADTQSSAITLKTDGIVTNVSNSKLDRSTTEVPTRSFTSISDAVRFSLMDMDDANDSVENQVLQTFQAVHDQTSPTYDNSTNEGDQSTLSAVQSRVAQQTSEFDSQSATECQSRATWGLDDTLRCPQSPDLDSSGEGKEEEKLIQKKQKRKKRNLEMAHKFWCEICHKGFFSAYNLRRHCRNVHKMDLPKGTSDLPFGPKSNQEMGYNSCSNVQVTDSASAEVSAKSPQQQRMTYANSSTSLCQSSPENKTQQDFAAAVAAKSSVDFQVQTSPRMVSTSTTSHTSPTKDFRLTSPTKTPMTIPKSPVSTCISPKFQRLSTPQPVTKMSPVSTLQPQQPTVVGMQQPNLVAAASCQAQQLQQQIAASQCPHFQVNLNQANKQMVQQRIGQLQLMQQQQQQLQQHISHTTVNSKPQQQNPQFKKTQSATSKIDTESQLQQQQQILANQHLQKLMHLRQQQSVAIAAATAAAPQLSLGAAATTGTQPPKLQCFQSQLPVTARLNAAQPGGYSIEQFFSQQQGANCPFEFGGPSTTSYPTIRLTSTETNDGLEDLEQFLLENMPWSGDQAAAVSTHQQPGNRPSSPSVTQSQGSCAPHSFKNKAVTPLTRPKPKKPCSKNLTGSGGRGVKKKKSCKRILDSDRNIASCISETDSSDSVQCINVTSNPKSVSVGVNFGTTFPVLEKAGDPPSFMYSNFPPVSKNSPFLEQCSLIGKDPSLEQCAPMINTSSCWGEIGKNSEGVLMQPPGVSMLRREHPTSTKADVFLGRKNSEAVNNECNSNSLNCVSKAGDSSLLQNQPPLVQKNLFLGGKTARSDKSAVSVTKDGHTDGSLSVNEPLNNLVPEKSVLFGISECESLLSAVEKIDLPVHSQTVTDLRSEINGPNRDINFNVCDEKSVSHSFLKEKSLVQESVKSDEQVELIKVQPTDGDDCKINCRPSTDESYKNEKNVPCSSDLRMTEKDPLSISNVQFCIEDEAMTVPCSQFDPECNVENKDPCSKVLQCSETASKNEIVCRSNNFENISASTETTSKCCTSILPSSESTMVDGDPCPRRITLRIQKLSEENSHNLSCIVTEKNQKSTSLKNTRTNSKRNTKRKDIVKLDINSNIQKVPVNVCKDDIALVKETSSNQPSIENKGKQPSSPDIINGKHIPEIRSPGRLRLRDTPKTSVKRVCPCCVDALPHLPKKCRTNDAIVSSPTKAKNAKVRVTRRLRPRNV